MSAEIAFRFALAELTPARGPGRARARSAQRGRRHPRGRRIADRRGALVELTAERAAVTELDATCHTPVGVHARLDGEGLGIEAFVGLPDGSDWVRDAVAGDAEDPVALGLELARRLLAAGAGEILERADGGAVR